MSAWSIGSKSFLPYQTPTRDESKALHTLIQMSSYCYYYYYLHTAIELLLMGSSTDIIRISIHKQNNTKTQ